MAHFYHSVYFWLRDNGEADDAQQTADACRTYLAGISGIVQMTVGFPAGTSGGPIDASYGVALLMEFDSKEARDIYEDHADHQRFIMECRHRWSRVQVYDSVPASPKSAQPLTGPSD